MQETWVQFLGPEDPLEKGMATHSGILAWRSPWIEELGGLQSIGFQGLELWGQRYPVAAQNAGTKNEAGSGTRSQKA